MRACDSPDKLMEAHLENQRALIETLDPAERHALAGLLAKLAAAED